MTTPALYIVATPIGNLNDLSTRAIEILKSVDLIIAEDTRHSDKLLRQYAITTPMTSFHIHNENIKTDEVIEKLLNQHSIALISDAGTPLISDPGFPLVTKAKALQIPVIPIPGPCAMIAALSASGLPCTHFSFHGFLPVKRKARVEKLESVVQNKETLVFYEAPHRVLDVLEDMLVVLVTIEGLAWLAN